MNSKGIKWTQLIGLVFLFSLCSGFLYSQTSPTVTLTDTDTDNLLSASDTVTITATFSEAMVATPTISITGVVTDVAMSVNPDVLLFSSATAVNTSAQVTNTNFSNEGINFGTVVKISADGSTLVTNSHYGKMIYIYKKVNGGWDLKQSIYGKDRNTDGVYTDAGSVGEYWAVSIDISGDGNTIVVNNPKNIKTQNWYNDGQDDTIMIYEYSSSLDKYEMTFETPGFSPYSPNSNTSFSIWDLSLSDDAGTLVGIRPHYSNSNDIQVYVININNLGTNSISADKRQRITFSGSDLMGNTDVQISGDGLTLVIKESDGSLQIYTRADNSSNFSFAQEITHTHVSDYLSDIAINYDGEFIVWSRDSYSLSGTFYPGQVIVYKKDSGTWSQFGSILTDPGSDGTDVHFGRTIDISGNGKTLMVASPAGNFFNYNLNTKPGKVYSYRYTESGFVYNTVVFDQTDYTKLSFDVSLSKTGEDFVIGNSPFLYKIPVNGPGSDKADVSGSNKNSDYGGSIKILKGIPTAYDYIWDIDSGTTPPDGDYFATVAGTASATSIAYSGTDSITFTLDTTAPTIQSIYSSTNGSYNQGDTVTLYLVSNEILTVDTSSGTPTISFDSSGTASYTTGSGTSSLTFTYTVAAGENSSDLNATAVSLNSATIKDNIGNNLDLTLTASGTTGALNANNDIVIDTTSPTLVITPPAGLKVTNSSVVTVTLTYNEPVTGLTTNVASYGAGTTGVGSLKLISFTSSTTAVVEIYPNAEGTVKLVHSPGAPNVTDLAGNTIASTVSCSFTYDITPPSTPVSPTLSIASDSGPRDYITGIVTPTFEGTAEASSTIYLYDSSDLNTAIGTATVASDGSYSVTVSDTAALSEATYNFVVVAVDQAGNISSASSPTQVQILTTAPPTPTVAPDLEAASDAGPSSTDNLTNVTTPTFSGTVTPSGLTVWLYQGSTAVASVTAANDGSYTISPTSALTSGDYVFTIKTENAVGNFSGSSPPLNVTIQTTPQAPTAPTLKPETDLGLSNSDNITSDSTPSIIGTISPTTSFKVYIDSTLFNTYTSDSNGEFEVDITTALNDADANEIYIELVDTFGNTATSTLLDLTIDTAAPSPSTSPVATDKKIAASSTTTYTVSDIAATDQVWLVPSTVSNADLKAYLVDPSSVTSLTLNTNITKQTTGTTGTIATPSAGGIYKIVVVDPAGNFSSLSTGSLDIDLTGPEVTSISQVTSDGVYTDDDANPSNSDTVTFTVNFDEATTITGTPRLPLTNITDANGNTVYATYVSGSGTASATFVYTVQDGDLSGGIDIASTSSLDLNGGSIKDLYNNDADIALSTNSVSLTSSIEVKATDPGLTVTITSDNSTSASNAKEGDVITVTVLSDTAWALDASTISMTITGLNSQPTITFVETNNNPYTYQASFTLTASNTYTDGGLNFAIEASDVVSSTKVTTPNKISTNQSILSGSFSLDNTTPSFTSTASLTITEGTTSGGSVTTDETVTYSITGGADQANVTINPTTGAISISPSPEFDTPTDANADGTYEIQVTVTDKVGYTTTRPMTVKVLEVPYGIEFTAVENSPSEGEPGSFTAVLTSPPTAPVTIPITISNTDLGNFYPNPLTFTPENWNVPQTVTVNTYDNNSADGDVTLTLATGKPTSQDTNYSGLSAADTNDFTITLVDDEVDADNDGFYDYDDAFPNDPNEYLDTDGDGIGDNADTDDDGDGQSDEEEIANGTDPLVANPRPGDSDGDGLADVIDPDDDNDGVADTLDRFPLDPNESSDNDGDGLGDNEDTDDDNDGFTDQQENNVGTDPKDPTSMPEDRDNDKLPDLSEQAIGTDPNNPDTDGDGVIDGEDDYPKDPNYQYDTDGDGIPNKDDPDDDNDGLQDEVDPFPLDPNNQPDSDGDGLNDGIDPDDDNDGFSDEQEEGAGTDPLDPNSIPGDRDNDGLTDVEEDALGTDPNNPDTDGDGVSDKNDSEPLNPNVGLDTDGDGIPDATDPDDDNDGVRDQNDAFPRDPNETLDYDGDGIGDNSDPDDDNDGYDDVVENQDGTDPKDALDYPKDPDGDGLTNNQEEALGTDPANPDTDGDGISDKFDPEPLDGDLTTDTDGDGIIDLLDPDDDNDGYDDLLELELGTDSKNPAEFPADQDGDLLPDIKEEELGTDPTNPDTDGDGVADGEDDFPLDANSSLDTDGDGIADENDSDDDNDGVPDAIDRFPLDPTESIDTDSDGIGDNADLDDDNDGYSDLTEGLGGSDPKNPSSIPGDRDNDRLSDPEEVIVGTDPNDPDTDDDGFNDGEDPDPIDPTNQISADDFDGDGIPNEFDPDDDNDGVPDSKDRFPRDASEYSDLDGDGIGDNSDPDLDGDGVNDVNDEFPYDPNESSDNDKDGIGDNADIDDDNDGYPDTIEIQEGSDPFNSFSIPEDADKDGLSDAEEIILGTDPANYDTDGDGVNDKIDAFPLDPEHNSD
ncbi:Ig-like domain-containing protein, partial [Flavobacteriaceae bacterium]|nr:Ig-like domain-containing protein [Flavobacteriaceae bacterium]